MQWIISACLAIIFAATPGLAADYSAKQVTEYLFKSSIAKPADFSGKNLSSLDLAGLDFKGASLANTDLSASDLTGANLSNADIAGGRLDRATLIRSDFRKARMAGVSVMSPTIFSTPEPRPADAPKFDEADLRGARISARLDGASFKKADLSRAVIEQPAAIWGSYQPRAVLNGANFSGAKLIETNFAKAVLQFVDFSGADLSGADLRNADLSKSDLRGANLSGAKISGADFDGARLDGVKGLQQAKGIESARNLRLPPG